MQEKNALMMRAAAEVNAALRSGRIPFRRALFPFDPNWRLWLPDLLTCIGNALHQVTSMKGWRAYWPFHAKAESSFDDAANRRASQANPFTIRVEGRVHAPSDAVQGVLVVDHVGVPLASARLQSGTVGNEQQFFLRILKAGEKETYRLGALKGEEFVVAGGEPISIGTADRVELSHRSQPMMLPNAEQAIEYSASAKVHFSPNAQRLRAWEQRVERNYRSLTLLLVVVTFAVVFLKPAWSMDRLRLVFGSWVLATGWLLGRALFYGLLNANVGWETYNYMCPLAPVFLLVLVLGTALASAALQRGIYRILAARITS